MFDLIEKYRSRFFNREDLYFRQCITTQGKTIYPCVHRDDDQFISDPRLLIAKHFAGSLTLSLPATSENGHCKWACYDVDYEDGRLEKVEAKLRSIGLNPHREARRPGRAGHSWVFFCRPIAAATLVRFNTELLAQAGLSEIEIEAFPKFPDHRHSQIRAPLGIHRKPGANNARGFFDECEPHVRKQLEWISNVTPDDPDVINGIAVKLFEIDRQRESARIPVSYPRSGNFYSNDILKMVGTVTRSDENNHYAPCPLCRMEGHDKSGDNLSIKKDGSKFTCMFGGPGKTHRAPQIFAALKR